MATQETHAAPPVAAEKPLQPAHAKVRLGITRRNSEAGTDPFDTVEWEVRDAIIPGKDGPLKAAGLLAARGNHWSNVWQRFSEGPAQQGATGAGICPYMEESVCRPPSYGPAYPAAVWQRPS